MGSEPPVGGRGHPDPSWEDVALSVAIYVRAFYLFLKCCWDPIRKSWTFLRDFFGGSSFEA